MKITLPNGEEIDALPTSVLYSKHARQLKEAILEAYNAGYTTKVFDSANKLVETQHAYWLDSVPEKHKKFAQEWDRLGRPKLEWLSGDKWRNVPKEISPLWHFDFDYRFKDDPHWKLRLKWINSDKTLPIEVYNAWYNSWAATTPIWDSSSRYREVVKKWEPPKGDWVVDLLTSPATMISEYARCLHDKQRSYGLVRQYKEHAEADIKLIRQFCRTLAWMRDKGYEPYYGDSEFAFMQLMEPPEREAFQQAIESGELEL